MTEEQYQKIKTAMVEHKRKLETDPEYRKRSEETKKRFEALGRPFGEYKG